MDIPSLFDLKTAFRNALVVNAETLFVLHGENGLGAELATLYLGRTVDCLPSDEYLGTSTLQAIDLDRHHVWHRIAGLHRMLDERRMSSSPGTINTDDIGLEMLVHLEMFLATIPHIALGAYDGTSVRSGCLRRLFELASAWHRLAEDISDALSGHAGLMNLRPADLALLGSMNERSLRNLVGPKNRIRTLQADKKAASRKGKSSVQSRAFVAVDLIDALDWLGSRKGFAIEPLKPAFVVEHVSGIEDPRKRARAALVALLVAHGELRYVSANESLSEKDLRAAGDGKASDATIKRLDDHIAFLARQ
ncbi:hypothetical protein C7451_1098 [Blastomonas natatoria]|uniref:Uncharacterized protein n=1 Tax=Blastomonas natatoria TaxID=34015 RepID=A0A2V3UWD8_9SPHN|nr:hypothetical protein C7451_1098 [Blastomonas natatoria]